MQRLDGSSIYLVLEHARGPRPSSWSMVGFTSMGGMVAYRSEDCDEDSEASIPFPPLILPIEQPRYLTSRCFHVFTQPQSLFTRFCIALAFCCKLDGFQEPPASFPLRLQF